MIFELFRDQAKFSLIKMYCIKQFLNFWRAVRNNKYSVCVSPMCFCTFALFMLFVILCPFQCYLSHIEMIKDC